MADIVVRIDVDFREDKLLDKLDNIKGRARDFGSVFKKIQNDLEETWSNNFMTNGLPSGGWAPLDSEYGSWKSINFPGMPPMIRTGKLFSSLGNLRGAPNSIGKKNAQFGTNVEYAKFHQYGTTKMPKRTIVFEPSASKKQWSRWTAEHLDGET